MLAHCSANDGAVAYQDRGVDRIANFLGESNFQNILSMYKTAEISTPAISWHPNTTPSSMPEKIAY